MSKVRVLPALIAVSIGVVAFKGVDIYQAVAQVVDGEAAGPRPETDLTAGVGDRLGVAANATAPPAAAPRAERRKVLDDRETGVETREQAAAAAEQRLQDQIAELRKVETNVQALLASMETKRDERMTSLIKTYEAMKPKDAAEIFDGMDDKVLLDLAKGMKPANLASVMSLMAPKRAEALTRMLAQLATPPADPVVPPKTPA
jgi:flagellar motility protein MotE (MotC chaperone)